MLIRMLTAQLSIHPDPAFLMLVFFAYSFVGYVMECVVLTFETKRLVLNRGFAGHLPFCIIYGFGALAGFAALRPIADNMLLLFVVGALGATVFEYMVARLQIRLFGDYWWDYTEKRMNYQGILCLESTLGWGLAAIVVVRYFHRALVGLLRLIPTNFVSAIAFCLLAAYVIDFVVSARVANAQKQAVQADAIMQKNNG